MVAIAQRVQRASIGVVYFQPKTASVSQNNNVVASLFISSPKPVTVVEVNISYDSAKLEFVSFNSSTSAFESTIQESADDGAIVVARAILEPAGIAGTLRICTITFKALVASGTSPVTISSGNAAITGMYSYPSISGPLVITFA